MVVQHDASGVERRRRSGAALIPKGKSKDHVRDAVRPMLERLNLGYKAGEGGSGGKHLAKGKAGAP